MEQLCKGGSCRKKLSEYREMTNKLYDDIYGLESDIKEKDKFLQIVVKTRNSLEMEVLVLKKKNSSLVEENNDLVAKNDQLDEDTDTGIELLRNANERENKVIKEFNDYKKNNSENTEKICQLDKENKELKTKFNFLKNKSLKENQQSSKMKEEKVKEQLIVANKQANDEFNKFKQHKTEKEVELNLKADQIESLMNENGILKQKNIDLVDELADVKISETQENPFKSSGTSLSDELAQIEMFQCEECNSHFLSETELKAHTVGTHEEHITMKLNLLAKVSLLEKNANEQTLKSTSSLYSLKKQEIDKYRSCHCKKNKRENDFCKINHQRYTYVRSKSDAIFSNLRNISTNVNFSDQETNYNFGAIRKKYSCNRCDREFQKQGDPKKHKRREHKERERKGGK